MRKVSTARERWETYNALQKKSDASNDYRPLGQIGTAIASPYNNRMHGVYYVDPPFNDPHGYGSWSTIDIRIINAMPPYYTVIVTGSNGSQTKTLLNSTDESESGVIMTPDDLIHSIGYDVESSVSENDQQDIHTLQSDQSIYSPFSDPANTEQQQQFGEQAARGASKK